MSLKTLKLLAAETDKPLQQFVLEALNDLLQKYRIDAVVTGPDTDRKSYRPKLVTAGIGKAAYRGGA
ncbi:hypothetical protein ACVWXL_008985 [Bradyrhizobium sp. GM22.5]